MGAGETTDKVTDKTSFATWHANFNATWASFEDRKKDYEEGIQRPLRVAIENETFFLLVDFKDKVGKTKASAQAKEERIREFKRFLQQAVDEPIEASLDELTTSTWSYKDSELSTSKETNFLAILGGTYKIDTDSNLDDIFKNFFQAYANREGQLDWNEWGLDEEEREYDDIEDAVAEGDLVAAERARAGFGSTEADEDPEINNQNIQCALMSYLYDDPNRFDNGGISKALTKSKRFHERILQLDHNKSDILNNFFVSDEGFKRLMQQGSKQNNIHKKLFYVYEKKIITDGKKNPITYETWEVPLSISTVEGDVNKVKELAALESELYSDKTPGGVRLTKTERDAKQLEYEQLSRGDEGKTSAADIFGLDNITIKYDGTNPSTARNDVDVSISFTLETFEALNAEISSDIVLREDKDGNIKEQTKLKLRDLVVAGIDSDGKAGSLNALKNSYSPFTNRIRLKVQSSALDLGMSEVAPDEKILQTTGTPLVLDLTTVDHTISRNATDGSVKFTINYKGYFHSILTMPFCDILPDADVRKSRQRRHANINQILKDNIDCKPETLREILRIERNSFEIENKDDRFGEILSYVYTRKGVYKAEFDTSTTSFAQAVRNIPKAGKNRFISSIGPALPAEYETRATDAATSEEGASDVTSNSSGQYSYFAFFGDLFHGAIKNLYKSKSKETLDEFGDFNLRFLFSPIQLPDPINGGTIQVYPINIPVDIFFFSQWWNEVVIKKDLKIYPAGSFARDFIERCLNNVLFEACLSHLLPDEKPPLLRCQYFTSKRNYRANSGVTSELSLAGCFYDPHDTKQASISRAPYPFFVEDVNLNDSDAKKIKSYNYLVIYQQAPFFSRELSYQRSKTMKEESTVATIVGGLQAKKFSQIKSISFSKTDSPYLREARYFNNNFGGLALMNNVYDLSFDFNKQHGNTYLFPGTIINFILADFSPVTTNLTTTIVPAAGNTSQKTTINITRQSQGPVTPLNYQYTNNDPHNDKVITAGNSSPSDAYLLGFGGYYVIKSVEYKLEAADSLWTISVTCKFLGTDFDTSVKRGKVIDSIESDQQACITYYNNARAYNDALSDEATEFTKAFKNNNTANQDVSSIEYNVSGVGAVVGTTNAPPAKAVTPATTNGDPDETPTVSTVDSWITANKSVLKDKYVEKKPIYYKDDKNDYYLITFNGTGKPTGSEKVVNHAEDTNKNNYMQ